MAIPVATTLVSVLRMPVASLNAEPYNEPSARQVTSTGIRAHIGGPVGSQRRTGGGEQESVQFRFDSDIADITFTDYLLDEKTQQQYRVVWIRQRTGLGLDHMEGTLEQITGVSGT